MSKHCRDCGSTDLHTLTRCRGCNDINSAKTRDYYERKRKNLRKPATKDVAELLFALEAALPFVKTAVGNRTCSSSGGPAAIEKLLKSHRWETQREKFL